VNQSQDAAGMSSVRAVELTMKFDAPS